MVNINITRMSSKGQIVIPVDMRKGFKKGDKLVIVKDKNRIIIKKADKVAEDLAEDLEFARRTEEAYKRIEAGEGITMDFDDFIKEMEKW